MLLHFASTTVYILLIKVIKGNLIECSESAGWKIVVLKFSIPVKKLKLTCRGLYFHFWRIWKFRDTTNEYRIKTHSIFSRVIFAHVT